MSTLPSHWTASDMTSLRNSLSSHPGWNEFLTQHWLKRPFLFEAALKRPFLSEDALLEMYRAARARTPTDENVIFYASTRRDDHGRTRWQSHTGEAAAHLLPSRDDSTLASYASRLRDSRSLRAFSAHLRYNMLRFCPQSWWRARALLTDLFEVTGFPAGGWDLDCYLGRYRETPFGVHADNEDQLYLTPVGTKVMKLWHPTDWLAADDPSSFVFRHEQHPARPLAYSVGPTDVLYWPQEYFHIGESPELALSVQINMRRAPACAGSALQDEGSGYGPIRPSTLARRAPRSGGRSDPPGGGAGRRHGRDDERGQERARYLLALRSAWFTTVDAPAVPFHASAPEQILAEDERFDISSDFPILYQAYSDEVLIVACNGEVWTMPNTTVGRRLLDRLSPGTSWSKRALHAQLNAGLSQDEHIEEEDLWDFLGELAEAGVLLRSGDHQPQGVPTSKVLERTGRRTLDP